MLGSRLAPVGAESKLNVSVLAGTSTSSAVIVNVSVLSSLIVLSKIGSNTGALVTSFTVTAKLFVSLRDGMALSVGLTVSVALPGPCTSLGVQVNTPLLGLMLAPAGGETKLNVSALAGTSESVATVVRVSVLPSLMV